MWRKLVAVLVLAPFCIVQFGCATVPTQESGQGEPPSPAGSAVGGAILGAIGGAALGALLGLIPFAGLGHGLASDVARGAISGAATGMVAGAIAGFAYGKYEERLYRDRQAAEAHFQYNPEAGEKVVLEAVEVKPQTAAQGENVSLSSVFTVLTGKDEPVPVEISQVVLMQGKICGQPFSQKFDKVSGTYGVTIPMQIPENAPPGKYTMITLVKGSKAADQKMVEFIVAKKAAAPTAPAPSGEPGAPEEKAPAEGETTG